MKKTLSAILIISIFLTLLFSTNILAKEKTKTVGCFTFIEYDTYCVLNECSTSNSEVIIPSSVDFDGKILPVTGIYSRAFENCYNLTSVIIPDSITSISAYAFLYRELMYNEYDSALYLGNADNPYHALVGLKDRSVSSITINEKTKVIADDAFWWCEITSVTIPESVISINGGAFSRCSNLESLTVSRDNEKYHSNGNCIIETKSKTLISGCKSSVIPDDGSIVSIGDEAFRSCDELISVVIPNGVMSIGQEAFSFCKKLTSVTIGNNVTNIGEEAFYCCSNLTSINIPDSVTIIGDDAFSSCDNLQYNEYDNALYLGNTNNQYHVLIKAKDYSITSAKINNKTKIICSEALKYCSSLTSVTIPNGITEISDSVFSGCSSLTSVTIPNGVTSIGGYAFYYCYSLTSVVIPDGVMSLGNAAFSNCSSLTSVTIPDSVTSIEGSAFYNCDVLNYNEYDNALYLGNSNNPYLVLIKAKDYSITSVKINEKTKIIFDSAFSGCSSLTSVKIPSGITEINSSTFSGCSSLTSVTIPNTVTSIGDSVFYGCSSLANVKIPESVTAIGEYAFFGCSALKKIALPDNIELLGGGVFCGCINLETILLSNELTNISSAWRIYDKDDWYIDGTFEECTNLKSIFIPGSIETIGTDSFEGCENLKTVYFGGSEDQWNNITIYDNNEALLNAEIVFDYIKPVQEQGDVNGDNEINNKDVVTLFRYVSGGEKAEDESVYDFNGDSEVNNKDVVELFRFVSAAK